MYKASQAYLTDMKSLYRGKSHVYVYLGLINNDCQRSAHITSSFSGSESGLYDNSGNGNVTSTENDGKITFTFEGNENNIGGLTLTFNGTAPSSVTVTNGTKTTTYVTSGTKTEINDGFTDCHYLTITPNSGKLKLKSIQFGIGLQFSDRDIINTNRTNVVSHISNELPEKKFTFTINNRMKFFNKDNPYGYSDYLMEEQEVRFEYGRELIGGGEYVIQGGKVYLQTWSSDDYEAKFTCTGKLNFLKNEYHKGQYNKNGVSAYTLAEDVLSDAKVTSYSLDPLLNSIKFVNPIPKCTHAEALQMIANASRCLLYEDRDGKICIKGANQPAYCGSVTFQGATDYSNPSSLFEENSTNYADLETGYLYADGSRIFMPDTDAWMSVGFVSSSLANASGTYSTTPKITINFNTEFNFKMMKLTFGVVPVKQFTIKAYNNNSQVNTETFTNPALVEGYVYEGKIDKIEIIFEKGTEGQRVHLNSIEMNGGVDYELTYRDLKSPPVANSLERVSKVNVHYYELSEYDIEGESSSQTAQISTSANSDGGITYSIDTVGTTTSGNITNILADVGDNLVTFNAPYTKIKVSAGTLKESGAYYCVVNSSKRQNIAISGNPLYQADKVYTTDIHEKGNEKTSSNPLISSLTMAQAQASWLVDYYDDDIEYDFTYRGDPILDADDLILLENQFVVNNTIRLVEESINTSMGMDFSNRIRARRTFYQTPAELSSAIVGRAKIGETL